MNNYVLVKVTGKNVNNYIKWLIKNKIDIINLDAIKHNELKMIIDYNNYDKLLTYSKTYKVSIIKKYGRLKLKDAIKHNSINILCLILSIIFLYLLSHIIFSVDIMYNDNEIINIINNELSKYGIQKYKLKKNYNYLSNVKEKILNDNKDILEWIEIEESGTKYIIRLVERKKEVKHNEYEFQSIIAAKDATILNIKAYSGEKNKQINEYVKKGDVIISGMLTKPDDTKIYVKANGIVTAETWYKASIEYPLYYQEEKITGKSKKAITINFLNYEIPLFPYKKYKHFQKYSNTLFESNFLPFKITKDKLYEVNVKEKIYTSEEAAQEAISQTKQKMQSQNNKIIEIKNIEILNKENLNSKIKLDLFISAIEDITEITELIPSQTEENIENN